jgi:hypothetical protein
MKSILSTLVAVLLALSLAAIASAADPMKELTSDTGTKMDSEAKPEPNSERKPGMRTMNGEKMKKKTGSLKARISMRKNKSHAIPAGK